MNFQYGSLRDIFFKSSELGDRTGGNISRTNQLLGLCCTSFFTLLFHEVLKPLHVNAQTTLSTEQLSKVNGEAKGIIKLKSKSTIKRLTSLSRLLLKLSEAAIQRFIKTGFLTLEILFDGLLTILELRKNARHLIDEGIDKLSHEWGLTGKTERSAIAHSPTQYPAQHIITTRIT